VSRRYDAVLLDAGNTLVFVDPARTGAILHRHGAVLDADRYARVERDARAGLAREVEEGVTGTEGHVWRGYFTALFKGMELPESAWEAATGEIVAVHARHHLWSHVGPGTAEALRALQDAGYRLGVVSNADGRVEALLGDLGLARFFELVVDSELVGVSKPDPRIFRIALEQMGVEPHRTLYVGDLYPVDVVGARGVGMDAVLLDPFDALGHRSDVDRIPSVSRLPEYLHSL